MFPDVGSITTLLPGMSFPSASATSTIRFAILSFTEPPADIYSTFATDSNLNKVRHSLQGRELRTKVATQVFTLTNLVQSDEWCVSDGIEGVVEDVT